jgi:PPOX class probable F420-dependent enzyme
MRLESAEARDRFARATVLRLGTSGPDNQPHIVPCTFALDAEGRVVIGIDNKPKSGAPLRRLRNIERNPLVSMLADRYGDDWTELWWARADGIATIERAGEPDHAGHWERLRAKYPQYAGQVLEGPVIVVEVQSWTGWSFR